MKKVAQDTAKRPPVQSTNKAHLREIAAGQRRQLAYIALHLDRVLGNEDVREHEENSLRYGLLSMLAMTVDVDEAADMLDGDDVLDAAAAEE